MTAVAQPTEILAIGMVTPVGLDAASAAAAVRAGVSRVRETSVYNKHFEPLRMSLVPDDALPPLAPELEAVSMTSAHSRILRRFKAVNVLGIVSMASARTRFSPDSPGRLIHTFIDQMNPDTTRAHGLDLFRLAESLGHVVVSGRVKAQLDGRFPHLVFRPLEKLVT